jgi:hypothetical protein
MLFRRRDDNQLSRAAIQGAGLDGGQGTIQAILELIEGRSLIAQI